MSTTTPQVAPQFISTLQDQAEAHLLRQLQALHAPAELIELVGCSASSPPTKPTPPPPHSSALKT